MSQSFPMNGGDGTCSYANNSSMQGDGLSALKDVIKETLIENLEIDKKMLSTFAIADLGCSVGPNTFYAMQTIIEAVQHKYKYNDDDQESSTDNCKLEFQVLFSDQIGNDFNTLFAALPRPRNYLVAAVPGSFHERLFPSSSIHVAYSGYALHWLSKVPDEVRAKDSPAWNAGKIHYTDASDAVVKAYADQYEQDIEIFLRARSQEIAPGGMMIILMLGVPHRHAQHLGCKLYLFFESILMDMVKEGILEKEKVDSFNIPLIFPYIEDMRSMVEKNKCFEIVKMELVDEGPKRDDVEGMIMHLRAMMEESIIDHFGNEIADQLFERAMQQKLKLLTQTVDSPVFGGILFAVLKRNLI